MGEGGDGRGDMSEVEIDQSREMIGQSETTTNVADTDDVADKTGTDMPEDTGRFKNLSVKRIADSKSQGRESHLPHETFVTLLPWIIMWWSSWTSMAVLLLARLP